MSNDDYNLEYMYLYSLKQGNEVQPENETEYPQYAVSLLDHTVPENLKKKNAKEYFYSLPYNKNYDDLIKFFIAQSEHNYEGYLTNINPPNVPFYGNENYTIFIKNKINKGQMDIFLNNTKNELQLIRSNFGGFFKDVEEDIKDMEDGSLYPKPIILETCVKQITNKKKFNTLFLGKNGKLYCLNFSSNNKSFTKKISDIDDTEIMKKYRFVAEEYKTNDYLKQAEVRIKNKFQDFRNFDSIYASRIIPNRKVFSFQINTDLGKSTTQKELIQNVDEEMKETELLELFFQSENVYEVDLVTGSEKEIPWNSLGPYKKEEYLKNEGIMCKKAFVGCFKDDHRRTAGLIKDRIYYTQKNVQETYDEANTYAYDKNKNFFGLQYGSFYMIPEDNFTTFDIELLNENDPDFKQSYGPAPVVNLNSNDLKEFNNDFVNMMQSEKYKYKCVRDPTSGIITGGAWTNAIYNVEPPACLEYYNVRLELNEFGLFVYKQRKATKDPEVETIFKLSDYDIDYYKDLITNNEWQSIEYAYKYGKPLKSGNFLGLGECIVCFQGKIKVYLDVLGYLRMQLSFNPTSPKLLNGEIIKKITRNMQSNKYFSRDLNYNQINCSPYNKKYLEEELFIVNPIKIDESDTPKDDYLINFKPVIDIKNQGTNIYNKEQNYSYKIPESNLDKSTGKMRKLSDANYINTNKKDEEGLLIEEISNVDENVCKTKCEKDKSCTAMVNQGKTCKLFKENPSKFLYSNNSSTVSNLTDNQNVFKKIYNIVDSKLKEAQIIPMIPEKETEIKSFNEYNTRNINKIDNIVSEFDLINGNQYGSEKFECSNITTPIRLPLIMGLNSNLLNDEIKALNAACKTSNLNQALANAKLKSIEIESNSVNFYNSNIQSETTETFTNMNPAEINNIIDPELFLLLGGSIILIIIILHIFKKNN